MMDRRGIAVGRLGNTITSRFGFGGHASRHECCAGGRRGGMVLMGAGSAGGKCAVVNKVLVVNGTGADNRGGANVRMVMRLWVGGDMARKLRS